MNRLDRRLMRVAEMAAHRLVPQTSSKFGTSHSHHQSGLLPPDVHDRRHQGQRNHPGRGIRFEHLCVTFNQPGHAVLAWKYHGERGWKVPPIYAHWKFRDSHRAVFSLPGAALDRRRQPLHQVSATVTIGVCSRLFIIFYFSERRNLRSMP